ncbi:MAG TPA: SpoIIE family protein phosphatase [Acidimicrobiia bacterium]
MNSGEFWWAGIHDFDRLLEAASHRLEPFGVSAMVFGVVDAVGDAHFVTTETDVPDVVRAPLTALLQAKSSDGSELAQHPDGTWVVAALGVLDRPVGAAAWLVASDQQALDSLTAMRGELALAIDVVAARYGRRRLRVGLAAVRRVSARLSGALTDADIAVNATTEAMRALKADACGMYELHGERLVLVEPAAGTPTLAASVPLDSESPVSDCVRNGAVIVRAMRAGGDISRHAIGRGDAPPAWLAMPLLVDDRPCGVLALTFAQPRTFTPDELALAATIADQSAQALERTRLHTELEAARIARSEKRFRDALDVMVDLVTIETAIRDDAGRISDFRIDYMNHTPIDVAGRSSEDLAGRTLLEAYPAMRDSELFVGYVEVVERGEPLVVAELPYADIIDGKEVRGFYSVHVAKFGDGLIISARDVSAMRQSRLDLEAAYEQLHAARRVAGLGIWSIDLATSALTFSEELYDMFGLDPLEPLPPVAEAIELLIGAGDIEYVRELLASTPRTREPFMVELTGRRRDGPPSVIMVAGTVSVDADDQVTRMWGTAQDITAQRAAEQSLQATTEQLAREHASLLLLQEAISPTVPAVEAVELHGIYEPAGEQARVGGDWFDAIALDDGAVALIVGDVAGHGLPAAALMAQLRHALRAYLVQQQTPAEALIALNHLARRTPGGYHATCLVAIYEPASHRFFGASAGHLPYAVVRDRAARLEDVNVGVPIGVAESPRYLGFQSTLAAGDTVLLFTDGLVERRGEPIDHGFARLLDTAAHVARPELPLADICQAIARDITPPGPALDDRCLLALRLP